MLYNLKQTIFSILEHEQLYGRQSAKKALKDGTFNIEDPTCLLSDEAALFTPMWIIKEITN